MPLKRLFVNRRGEVLLALKRPFRDDSTHLGFMPADFMARLATLVQRPLANLTRYHCMLAPAHPWRRCIGGAGLGRRGRMSGSALWCIAARPGPCRGSRQRMFLLRKGEWSVKDPLVTSRIFQAFCSRRNALSEDQRWQPSK